MRIMEFHETIAWWMISTLLLLSGVKPNCNVANCNLDYCNGDGCIKCIDGYYLYGLSCYQCRSNCVKCTAYSTCTECVRGKYGSKCDSNCPSACPACNDTSSCTECVPGRYGSSCVGLCSLGCSDILCDKVTGKCSSGCRHGYYKSGDDCNKCPEHCTRCDGSDSCSVCVQGYYGTYCQHGCASGCRNRTCDKNNGYCLEGCTDQYYMDGGQCHECPYRCSTCDNPSTCETCKTGYWGPQCENDCPLTCNRCTKDGQCSQNTDCGVSNCDPDYCSGTSCIKCNDGYYLSGFTCYRCQPYCTKCTGQYTCTECQHGRHGYKCEDRCQASGCPYCLETYKCPVCYPGRYGSYCQNPTPLGCIDILSDKDTGTCTLGCRHGYYKNGEDCLECPERCERCADNRNCSSCKSGYYGTYCQNICPSSCKDEICDKALGRCTSGCAEGFYLRQEYCVDCPWNCMSCESSESCLECKTGYWGTLCQFDCPIECNKCTKTGQCIYDTDCSVSNCNTDYCSGTSCIKCNDGYYLSGFTCYRCPTYCTKCTAQYTCTECQRGRYGYKCEETCPNQCPHCLDSDQCTECVPGRYGSNCQNKGPLGCIDLLSDKNTGRCTLGCRHGYYKNGVYCFVCPTGCKRCTDSTHCSICKTGYYGTYCQNSCSSSCKDRLCDKDQGHCLSGCSDGFYLSQDDCISCPDRCVGCDNKDRCTGCKTGYWGLVCEKDCPTTCYKCSQTGECISYPDCDINNCHSEYCVGSSCIKCKDGYYLSGRYCYQCPSGCVKCSGSSTCSECERGKYGSKCQYTCRTECPDCTSSSVCTECIPGRYGSDCYSYCPLACRDILCDKVSGKCTIGCRHGYYQVGYDCVQCHEHCTRCSDGTTCTDCEIGYYGTDCQSTCPQSCKNQNCDKVLGTCLHGCADGYYSDGSICLKCPSNCRSCSDMNNCDECKTGHWGQQCQNDCPINCLRCTKDGTCLYDYDCDINNCDKDFCSGKSCIRCLDGYYLSGRYCYQCPSDCTMCTGSSTCTGCIRGKYGSKCDSTCNDRCIDCFSSNNCTECIPGRYGSDCYNLCPLGCRDILCDKYSGKCTRGCRHGYYLNEGSCEKCPGHCTLCDASDQCTACVTGFYGSVCQHTCNALCLNQLCDKTSGLCHEGCGKGYYAEENSCVTCPSPCVSCTSQNNCTECLSGYWGPQCQADCPYDCNKCNSDGVCIDAYDCDINNCDKAHCSGKSCIQCQDGYYLSGSNCYNCQAECTKCTGYSTCTDCVQGKYGSECQNSCYDRCVDCVNSTHCTECKPGRHGSDCSLLCSLGCRDLLCDKDSGKCTRGCMHGYYLNGVTCEECPEHCTKCNASDQCTTCVIGYYGSVCQHTCHHRCLNQVCEKQSGQCTEGCGKGYYAEENNCVTCPSGCVSCVNVNNCTDCQAGYWGPLCQFNCPDGCFKCNSAGICTEEYRCDINNCIKVFCSGRSCLKCQDGYYLSGSNCHRCQSGCTTCTGYYTCTDCVQGKYGSTCQESCYDRCVDCINSTHCTECIPGRHGSDCDLTCSFGCRDILCDKDSGKCTRGCRHGYYLNAGICKACPGHCTKCNASDQCTSCETGFHGSFCQHTCHQGCLKQRCDKISGQCSEGCGKGFYAEENNCVTCPTRCVDCANTNNCTECLSGYWGSLCQFDCPDDCIKCNLDGICIDAYHCDINNCDKGYCIGSSCIKCKDGYYLSGSRCFKCQPGCATCTGYYTCTDCIQGKYGLTCQDSCYDRCEDCVNSTHCTECKPGRHGSDCSLLCSLGCRDILCDKDTGKCTKGCRHGYYSNGVTCAECPEHCTKCNASNQCIACDTGYYGSFCQYTCNQWCLNQLCYKTSGQCSEGCDKGYYAEEKNCVTCPAHCKSCANMNNCTGCLSGYWGLLCELECPDDCVKCDSDGICIDDGIPECNVYNCQSRFCSGNICTQCEDGYYVSTSLCHKCPQYCTQCSSSSTCTECVRGKYGYQCDSVCSSTCQDCVNSTHCTYCIPGRYGVACQSYCSLGCNNIWCVKDTGKCIDGCRSGYYFNGKDCKVCPENCARCSNSSVCSICKTGYYGTNCLLACPRGCKDELCNKDTGHCEKGCGQGFYYDYNCIECQFTCSNCVGPHNCTECKAGFWGMECENHCPGNCYRCNIQGQCIEESADCDVPNCDRSYCSGSGCIKCQAGYYLSETRCYICPSGCLSCTNAFSCSECNKGSYGSTCESKCKNTCMDCTNSTQCTDCIPGRYGSACDLSCSLGCKGIKCDKTTGRCTTGCNIGYYPTGKDCQACPNRCSVCSNNTHCISCTAGYYGFNCQKICPAGCKNHLCDAVSGNCTEGCTDGYHINLGYCVEDLDPTNCKVSHCTVGHCFGNVCTQCQAGYYNEALRCYKCPDNCMACSSSSKCERCVSGRQGSTCQFQCSLGCKDSACSIDGFCTEGCREGYTMTGGECRTCPRNCLSCSFLDSCDKCAVGYWGNLCQYDCKGCDGVGCGQQSICVKGCIDGYYEHITGPNRFECAQCPAGCQTCTDNESCSSCKAGYWGVKCQSSCSVACKDKLCTKHSGHCEAGCKNGYYGNTCSQKCLLECDTCKNEFSCESCRPGRYGANCENECSANCFRRDCFRINGTCANGCSAGYSGDWCMDEKECTVLGQTDKQSSDEQSGSDKGAAIGLGVVLAITFLVIGVVAVYLLRRRHSRKHEEDEGFRNPAAVINPEYSNDFSFTKELRCPEKARIKEYNPSKPPKARENDKGTSDITDLDRRRYQSDSNHGNDTAGNLNDSARNDANSRRINQHDGVYSEIWT